jgi:16S rRNA (cytosine1402-N4)-methyltransferase
MNKGMPTHTPVLLEEAMWALAVLPGGRYIDCTLGGGGYAVSIMEHSQPGGQLLGLDADPEAMEAARGRLAKYGDSVLLVNDNFANLEAIAYRHDFHPVNGIIFDLGLSSLQLGSAARGFSFQEEGPLDMRFSPSLEVTAADIVNRSSEVELARIIRAYGEEPHAQRIARFIVKERPLATTRELADLVEQAVGGRKGKIHPATRTFQALRIAVNHELGNLETALKQAVNLLGFGGRLVVVSYHSLEDRVVKHVLQRESRDCVCPPGTPQCLCGHTASLRTITKRVITPSPEELEANPRSRSARLRAAERIVGQGEYQETAERLCLAADTARGWRRPVLLGRLRMAFGTA